MKTYDKALLATLTTHIQMWVDSECSDDPWTETGVIVDPDIASRMSDAAYAVFQAVYESQAYALREGYVKNDM